MLDYSLVQIILNKLATLSATDWMHIILYVVIFMGLLETINVLSAIHDAYGPK
jgi:hypothetical protein